MLKVPRLPIATESQDMTALAQWLNLRRVLWTHVPNGGLRHIATAARMKREGVAAGVPDILIFTRPKLLQNDGSEHVGTALELKRAKGGRLSPEQVQWLDGLHKLGWYTLVGMGLTDAIKQLTTAGY